LFLSAILNNNQSINYGSVIFAVVNTLLYPYSRWVYENVIGYIMGNNVFFVNAVLMLIVKIITIVACWSFAMFVAPIGLVYLFFRNSPKNS